MLYYKANSNRIKAFQTYVEILDDGRVCKGALNPEAIGHLENIYTNACFLAKLSDHFDLNYTFENHRVYCDKVKGTSLSEILVDYLKDHQYEKLESTIWEYLHSIDELLPAISYSHQDSLFGTIRKDPAKIYTNVANLDFNFDNIFVCENTFKVIDCEWCFDLIIPKEFIQYRSLLYFYSKYSFLFKEYKSYEEWMACFGIEDLDYYFSLEDTFQQYVYGANRQNNLVERFFENNRKKRNPKKQNKQLFSQLYMDEGNGISEENSIILNVEHQDCHLTFKIDRMICNLRFDPLNQEGIYEIKGLYLHTKEGKQNIPLSDLSSNGMNRDRLFAFLSRDPQINITNINQEVEALEVEFSLLANQNHPDFLSMADEIYRNKYHLLNDELIRTRQELNAQKARADYMADHPFKNMIKGGIK